MQFVLLYDILFWKVGMILVVVCSKMTKNKLLGCTATVYFIKEKNLCLYHDGKISKDNQGKIIDNNNDNNNNNK